MAYTIADFRKRHLKALSGLFEDSRGWLWVGTWGGGLNRFGPRTETFTPYDANDGLQGNFFAAWSCRSANGMLDLWAAA